MPRATSVGSLWTQQHRELETRIQAFVAKEILPHVEQWETEQAFPVELIRKMGREGFFGVDMPEKYSGAGTDVVSSCIISEEAGKAGGGVNATLLVHGVIAIHPIYKLGNEEQKQKYLGPAIRGE